MADFPLLVRSRARSMWAALAMFALPAVACFVLVQVYPDLIHMLMDNRQIAEMERMYDPAAERLGRDSGTDWMMFGHYIMNNISIALRAFASGLLAGLGTLLVLLFNGVIIGSVAGHLQHIGHGDPFWRFVVGHGAFELTAIVIAGGAGLQLGMKLLAPGRRSRLMHWSTAAASARGCASASPSCCWWPPSSKPSGHRSPKYLHGASSAWPVCCGPACCCGCGAADVELAMRIDHWTWRCVPAVAGKRWSWAPRCPAVTRARCGAAGCWPVHRCS